MGSLIRVLSVALVVAFIVKKTTDDSVVVRFSVGGK
jgi:hypothetical protein